MTSYHCPDCGKTVKKESFGYPICCGSTMRTGEVPSQKVADVPHLKELVKDLDNYVADNTVTDWELGFIADMADQSFYSHPQQKHILRLWEKYCA